MYFLQNDGFGDFITKYKISHFASDKLEITKNRDILKNTRKSTWVSNQKSVGLQYAVRKIHTF